MMALVVVPDIANPFFAEVLRGIDETLSSAGYGLIIGNLDNHREKDAAFVEVARSGQVDGALLLETPDGEIRAQLVAGQAYARKVGVEHNVINNSPHEVSFVEIEIR